MDRLALGHCSCPAVCFRTVQTYALQPKQCVTCWDLSALSEEPDVPKSERGGSGEEAGRTLPPVRGSAMLRVTLSLAACWMEEAGGGRPDLGTHTRLVFQAFLYTGTGWVWAALQKGG